MFPLRCIFLLIVEAINFLTATCRSLCEVVEAGKTTGREQKMPIKNEPRMNKCNVVENIFCVVHAWCTPQHPQAGASRSCRNQEVLSESLLHIHESSLTWAQGQSSLAEALTGLDGTHLSKEPLPAVLGSTLWENWAAFLQGKQSSALHFGWKNPKFIQIVFLASLGALSWKHKKLHNVLLFLSVDLQF